MFDFNKHISFEFENTADKHMKENGFIRGNFNIHLIHGVEHCIYGKTAKTYISENNNRKFIINYHGEIPDYLINGNHVDSVSKVIYDLFNNDTRCITGIQCRFSPISGTLIDTRTNNPLATWQNSFDEYGYICTRLIKYQDYEESHNIHNVNKKTYHDMKPLTILIKYEYTDNYDIKRITKYYDKKEICVYNFEYYEDGNLRSCEFNHEESIMTKEWKSCYYIEFDKNGMAITDYSDDSRYNIKNKYISATNIQTDIHQCDNGYKYIASHVTNIRNTTNNNNVIVTTVVEKLFSAKGNNCIDLVNKFKNNIHQIVTNDGVINHEIIGIYNKEFNEYNEKSERHRLTVRYNDNDQLIFFYYLDLESEGPVIEWYKYDEDGRIIVSMECEGSDFDFTEFKFNGTNQISKRRIYLNDSFKFTESFTEQFCDIDDAIKLMMNSMINCPVGYEEQINIEYDNFDRITKDINVFIRHNNDGTSEKTKETIITREYSEDTEIITVNHKFDSYPANGIVTKKCAKYDQIVNVSINDDATMPGVVLCIAGLATFKIIDIDGTHERTIRNSINNAKTIDDFNNIKLAYEINKEKEAEDAIKAVSEEVASDIPISPVCHFTNEEETLINVIKNKIFNAVPDINNPLEGSDTAQ